MNAWHSVKRVWQMVLMLVLTALGLACAARRADAQAWRTALTAGAVAGVWVDYSQTRAFLRAGLEESNPVLGPRPSALGLAAYSVGVAALNVWAPRKVRPLVNLATIAFQAYAIAHNAGVVGLRFYP